MQTTLLIRTLLVALAILETAATRDDTSTFQSCLTAKSNCEADPNCAILLHYLRDVCGSPNDCQATDIGLCLNTIKTLQSYTGDCDCDRESTPDEARCVHFRNLAFNHECSLRKTNRVRHQQSRSYSGSRRRVEDLVEVIDHRPLALQDGISSSIDCSSALKQCTRHAACERIWLLFKTACPTRYHTCLMSDRQACYESFEGLRWTPLANCTCVNDHRVHASTCPRIQLATAHNRCILQLRQENYVPRKPVDDFPTARTSPPPSLPALPYAPNPYQPYQPIFVPYPIFSPYWPQPQQYPPGAQQPQQYPSAQQVPQPQLPPLATHPQGAPIQVLPAAGPSYESVPTSLPPRTHAKESSDTRFTHAQGHTTAVDYYSRPTSKQPPFADGQFATAAPDATGPATSGGKMRQKPSLQHHVRPVPVEPEIEDDYEFYDEDLTVDLAPPPFSGGGRRSSSERRQQQAEPGPLNHQRPRISSNEVEKESAHGRLEPDYTVFEYQQTTGAKNKLNTPQPTVKPTTYLAIYPNTHAYPTTRPTVKSMVYATTQPTPVVLYKQTPATQSSKSTPAWSRPFRSTTAATFTTVITPLTTLQPKQAHRTKQVITISAARKLRVTTSTTTIAPTTPTTRVVLQARPTSQPKPVVKPVYKTTTTTVVPTAILKVVVSPEFDDENSLQLPSTTTSLSLKINTDVVASSQDLMLYGGPPDIDSLVQQRGGSLRSTCIEAYAECQANVSCRIKLSKLMEQCLDVTCRPQMCRDALRNFYSTASEQHSNAMTFCVCSAGDTRCIRKRETLFPKCINKDRSADVTCETLRLSCESTGLCRYYNRYYEMCRTADTGGGCHHRPERCRNAFLRVRGSTLESQCQCIGQNISAVAECAEFRESLPDKNLCLKEAIIDLQLGHPWLTSTGALEVAINQDIATQSFQNTSTISAHGRTVKPSKPTITKSTIITTTQKPTFSVKIVNESETLALAAAETNATLASTTTVTTPKPGCTFNNSNGAVIIADPGQYVRNFTDRLFSCSEICLCNDDFSTTCHALPCITSNTKCKGQLIDHEFGETLYVPERGRCTCYIDGEYVCQTPSKTDSPLHEVKQKQAIFLAGGFSLKEFHRIGPAAETKLSGSGYDVHTSAVEQYLDKLNSLLNNPKCQFVNVWSSGGEKQNFVFELEAFGNVSRIIQKDEQTRVEITEEKWAGGRPAFIECRERAWRIVRDFDSGIMQFDPLLSSIKQVLFLDHVADRRSGAKSNYLKLNKLENLILLVSSLSVLLCCVRI